MFTPMPIDTFDLAKAVLPRRNRISKLFFMPSQLHSSFHSHLIEQYALVWPLCWWISTTPGEN
jgi:hypothetical protein